MLEYGLSLGSNAGDRLANLSNARARILSLPGVMPVTASAVYETEPVEVPPEFADILFLNAVLVVNSSLEPEDMAPLLSGVQTELGREPCGERNSPRSIDIDIIYAGTMTVSTPSMIIPHPRWAGRRFVVQPLADVRPNLILPGQTKTVSGILLTLPPRPKVVLFTDAWRRSAAQTGDGVSP